MAARTRKKGSRRAGSKPPDREALGLTLLAVGILVLGILLPVIPTGDLLAPQRDAALGAVGFVLHVLPWPMLVLGALFLVRRQPPGWLRVLLGFSLAVVGAWVLTALVAPAATGSWGTVLNTYLSGAAGVLGGAASVVLMSFGFELMANWPLTTITRVGGRHLIEFLNRTFRAALAARRSARNRAGFHADVVQERLKLRDLDRELATLAGMYPNSGEVSRWRTDVQASRESLNRAPDQARLEDARMDVAAWQAAVSAFTRDRAAELAAVLSAEGLPGFEDWTREMRAELDESFIEPITPARALDDLRNALGLDLTALHERHRRLLRERDLAEPTLKQVRARDLVRINEQHEARQVEFGKVRDDAAELDRMVRALETWRPLAADLFRATNDHGSYEEMKDLSATLAGELREKGREVLSQLEGWSAALDAVVERATEDSQLQSLERRLAEERAVEERVRALAAAERAEGTAGSTASEVVRWPRELEDERKLDPSSPSRRLAEERARREARPESIVRDDAHGMLQEPPARTERDPDPEPQEASPGVQLPLDPEPADGPEPGQVEPGQVEPGQVEPAKPQPDSYPPPRVESRPTGSGDGALAQVPPERKVDSEPAIPEVGGIDIQVPPYSLLDLPEPGRGNTDELDAELNERVARIDETLKNFRLEGRVTASVRGPTVTRFEVEPAPGEKISRFANLSDDLALAMAVGSVRIEAPIPGKSVIGLEVPNASRDLIRFREAAEAPGFRRAKARLPLILGKSIDGEMVVGDLARMPHLLIAGSTGSGKSVAVNTLVGSLIYRFLPTELRFLMIDPKMVELTPYDGIPHMLRPVVTNPADAAAVLLGAVSHMERRYKMMSKLGAKNLDQYNEKAKVQDLPQLPFVVIIIDELADLMITSPKEVESAIMRLAQMARATGMHLVLATQRPSVDILTSLIKVNVPARMAFAVSSGHDSRTILDTMGAERLVGMGDMLYYQPGLAKPVRLQGPFISETEIANVAGFLRRQFFEDEFVEAYGDDFDPPSLHESDATGYIDWNDDKLRVAAEMVINEGQASVSRLQRRLQVGHARAGKLMDSLEALGVVGPHTGSKPREVLVAIDELPNIFGK